MPISWLPTWSSRVGFLVRRQLIQWIRFLTFLIPMKQKKVYDLVKELLERYPKLRDSDKLLIWNVWGHLGYLDGDSIKREVFLSALSPETVTRARRKVQEIHPELRASKEVQEYREEKAETKGLFIFDD